MTIGPPLLRAWFKASLWNPRQSVLIASFLEVQEKQKALSGRPPPPPQKEHHTYGAATRHLILELEFEVLGSVTEE